jgi:hypothetical protein
VSKILFGHVFAAVDILVIVHLLIAGLGAYFLLQYFRPSRGAALFAGLTWPLCGFVLFSSNSWVIISITAAYFPWILLISFCFFRKPSRKLFVAGIIVRLLLFYGGHIQYFVYSVIFEAFTLSLYVLFSSESKRRVQSLFRYVRSFALTYVCVLVLSLPLLLPMFHLTSISASRSGALPFDIFSEYPYSFLQLILAFLFPFLKSDIHNSGAIWNFASLAHIGYATIIILLVGAILFFHERSRNRQIRPTAEMSVFLIAAGLAFVWATSTLFNRLIYLLPILNRFRWPFKLTFFLCFYMIMIAAFVFSSFLNRLKPNIVKQRFLLCAIVLIQLANFWILYAVLPYRDFGEHHADQPPLQEELRDTLEGGRILTYGFDTWCRSTSNDRPYQTAPTLSFNYATLWGLDYFAGYEILLPSTNSKVTFGLNITGILRSNLSPPMDVMREAGVCWYIVPSDKAVTIWAEYPEWQIRPELSDDFRTVFFDPKAQPIFSDSSGQPIQADQIGRPANTIELTINAQREETISVRYILNPFLKAYSEDGTALTITPVNAVHFKISVPAGTSHVTIRYSDPYFRVGSIASGVGLVLITAGVLFRRKDQRISAKEKPGHA